MSNNSTALAAVALQDHLTRSLALNLATVSSSKLRSAESRRKERRKCVKPVVDTGRAVGLKCKTKRNDRTEAEREYVLDPLPPTPTLAQRLGLVDAPVAPLTEAEWGRVKQSSNSRDDSAQPCVICKEDFGLQEQVLLSCTHVFHRACLHAFEHFTGRKTCPMCRREQYQTRVIHEAARRHRHTCATVIQSAWRGHVVRCWYRKLRETVPPSDPRLRVKFYQDKLSSITDRLVRSLDTDVASFLQQIDASVRASRDVLRQFDEATKRISDEQWRQVQLKAIERGTKDCPICLTQLDSARLNFELSTSEIATIDGHHEDSCGKTDYNTASMSRKASPPRRQHFAAGKGDTSSSRRHFVNTSVRPQSKGDSHESRSFTVRRRIANKPQSPLEPRKTKGTVSSTQTNIPGTESDKETFAMVSRKVVLTSCSHVFHVACLETLEEFTIATNDADVNTQHLCPVCRSSYQKRVL